VTVAQEHLAVILFIVAIVEVVFGVLVALLLLFRDQQQGTRKKTAKRFLLSNGK
jgi:hypothetical protein